MGAQEDLIPVTSGYTNAVVIAIFILSSGKVLLGAKTKSLARRQRGLSFFLCGEYLRVVFITRGHD